MNYKIVEQQQQQQQASWANVAHSNDVLMWSCQVPVWKLLINKLLEHLLLCKLNPWEFISTSWSKTKSTSGTGNTSNMHSGSKSHAGLSNPFLSLEALVTSFNKHFWRLTFLLLLDTKAIHIQGLLIDLLKTEKHVRFQAQTQRERNVVCLWGRALCDDTIFLKLVSDVECHYLTSRCFTYKLFFAEIHSIISPWFGGGGIIL